MYQLGLERAEEPDIKLSTLLDHRVSKGVPETKQNKTKQKNKQKTPTTSASPSLITLKRLTVWITANCGKF